MTQNSNLRPARWTTFAGVRIPNRVNPAQASRSARRRAARKALGLVASWIVAAAVTTSAPTAVATTGTWVMHPDGSVVGRPTTYIARYEDTLLDIARRFRMGSTELRRANPGVDIWLPGEGTPIRIPSRYILPEAPRAGLVINVPEMRIYYYPNDESVVRTWPISIGRVGFETPVGETTIVRKKVGPTWWPTESIRDELAKQGKILPEAVLPGPDNPLGSHALYLGFPQYLIHGTNQPNSIGMRVSHGCVRMYPEHIVELFEMVGPGTPVTIVHQRIKAGWEGNDLYIEVHPNIGVRDDDSRPSMTDVVTSLIAATSDDEALPAMNWEVVEAALAAADGVPVAVGRRPDIQTASHWMTAK